MDAVSGSYHDGDKQEEDTGYRKQWPYPKNVTTNYRPRKSAVQQTEEQLVQKWGEIPE